MVSPSPLAVSNPRRTWSTEVRDPWNAKIHNCLQSVDSHVSQYLKTGDRVHLEMAEMLRQYVLCLKDYIHTKENR